VLGVPVMRASPWARGSMAIVRIGDIAAWEVTSLSQTGRSCPPAPSLRCNVCQARQAPDSSIGCQTGVRPILRSAPRWQPVGCESAGRIDRGRGRDHALWRRDELALNAKMAEGVGFEPTIRLPVYTLSRRAPSTARPSLRLGVLSRSAAETRSVSGTAEPCRAVAHPA
jgi:hypothetical protein